LWLGKKDRLNHPDKEVFDLEPSDLGFEKVNHTAISFWKYFRIKPYPQNYWPPVSLEHGKRIDKRGGQRFYRFPPKSAY